MIRRRDDSMISSVMRHLKAVQVVPADMVDLILMVLILAIYSEIYFGDLFGGSRRSGGRANQGPMKGMQHS